MKRWICLVLALAISLAALGAALAEDPEFARRYAGGRKDVPTLAERYEEAANHGDVNAAIRLAEMYEEGQDVKRDPGRAQYFYDLATNQLGADELLELARSRESAGKFSIAAAWYQRAADKGSAEAAAALAGMYAEGRCVAQDAAKAAQLYDQAADPLDADELIELAESREGAGDTSGAAELYRRAADKGGAQAQFQIGCLYAGKRSGEWEYVKQAVDYLNAAILQEGAATRVELRAESDEDAELTELCNAITQAHLDGALTNDRLYSILLSQIGGEAESFGSYLEDLGWEYDTDNDESALQNDAQAAYWYEFAAEQGDALAQNNLGYMYQTGRGVEQDDAQAVYWFKLSAEQGNASAQYRLGVLHSTGRGVGQDDAQAVYWYKLAAEQGNAAAQCNLGYMYFAGKGVEQDDAQAIYWFKLVAEQCYATAQGNLGFMYENGRGVEKDISEAIRWYKLAAEQGNADAQSAFDRLQG